MGFYRNTCDLVSLEGIEVDNGALWAVDLEKDILVLVDEEQYATHKLNGNFVTAL
jgi:hypothetical protein